MRASVAGRVVDAPGVDTIVDAANTSVCATTSRWRTSYLLLWLACAGWAQQPADEAILRHAIELHQAGDMDGAIREYRSYLKQAPGNVMARSNLGAALVRSGRYDEGIAE